MKSFYEKEDYSIEDIQSLITNEVEESIYLDFKEAGALDKSDGKRKDISKDVASFANSDGGIIIYGIKELDHKAHSLSYVNGNIFTKEWLEQVINSSIQRNIPSLLIFPLRENGDIEKTIYIIKIPRSIDAPHISKDNRFYKRFNFLSVPMEEYEIRQSYGRKSTSFLQIFGWGFSKNEARSNNERIQFEFSGTIINSGDVVESTYKVNAYINNPPKSIDISYDTTNTNHSHTIMENKRIKISATGTSPIFPNETLTVLRFNISLPLNIIREVVKDVEIELRVMYSGGEDQSFIKLNDLALKYTDG
ncbi:AlbA family DNA-binding domain-containing protein [Spirosoma endophyticum]|uniref:Putative DNA-binding domain-containing protein n=1 Tax=Spirosoma endophyticum TaxID=662367 RepID=A0A1I1U9I2_9BACT|nr:ATP-binding protein [Spirosoma endophyticum]SFD67295.1 Putative DNA-binding domain-containing protein [Spirosoma endophyticum]